ncbi:3-oxo-5-alpha-steroid 4-dehydrogenase 1 [Fukomys damarensis]|uniref:3-oxo-5-alpha-steroid 4-dehydrogenase 1 n=1 Tax=Fukomys damarensis TaxID=885580 RepID=A0A091CPZ0_FUKDA|nr:3-oxo-5-alpha-steroid 4-dehydrogenase 1 [Fukomys damarensis]
MGHGVHCPAAAMVPVDVLAYLTGLTGCWRSTLLLCLASPRGRYASQWPGLWLPALLPGPCRSCRHWPGHFSDAPTSPTPRPPAQLRPAGRVPHPLRAQVPDLPLPDPRRKATPLFPCVSAFLFCTYNGYLQCRYLSQYTVYAEDWMTQP